MSSKVTFVAGVTSKTTLMAVKVLGASGSGPFAGIFAGIMYATDNGANVISMSLGSYFTAEQYGRSPGQIRAAIQQSADDLGQLGTDPQYGKGRINVARAVGVIVKLPLSNPAPARHA